MTLALAQAELWLPLADLQAALGLSRPTMERRVERGLWQARADGSVLLSSLDPEDQATYQDWSSGRIYKDAGRLHSLPKTADRLALELEASRRFGLLQRFFDGPPCERTDDGYARLNAALVDGVPDELRGCPDLLRHRSPAVLQRTYRLAKQQGAHRTLGRHGDRKKGYGEQLSKAAKGYLEHIWPEQVNWCVKLAWTSYRAQAKKEGWKSASYSTIRKYLRSLPADAVLYKAHGERRFNKDHAPYVRRVLDGIVAGAFLCGDHHQFDVMVWDGRGGKPFRPWLTAWLDLRSRAVTGWVICRQPSSKTILEAFLHAISPKQRPEYERMCGIPDDILEDNGRDYRSRTVEGETVPPSRTKEEDCRIVGFLEKVGIAMEHIHHALPYHARSKPIERWFLTLCNQFAKAMGEAYVGNCAAHRPEQLREAVRLHERFILGLEPKSPFMTVEEFRTVFEKWLFTYHCAAHSSLSEDGVERSPLDCLRLYGRTPRIARDTTLELLALWPPERRTVRNGGVVQIRNLEYYNPALCQLQAGTEVQVCIPEELGRIYVYEMPPSDRFICEATSVKGFRMDDVEGGRELIAESRRHMRSVRARARALGADAPEGSMSPAEAIVYGVPDLEEKTFRPADAVVHIVPQLDGVKPRQAEAPPRRPELLLDEKPAQAAQPAPRLRGLLGDEDDDWTVAQASGGGESR